MTKKNAILLVAFSVLIITIVCLIAYTTSLPSSGDKTQSLERNGSIETAVSIIHADSTHDVLLTAALASCQRNKEQEWTSGNKVYIRSDSTAPYSRVYHPAGPGLWYFAFRPYGGWYNGHYRRIGYYSDAISEHSNLGTNTAKSEIVRGGFGESAHGEVPGGEGAHASS